MAGWHRGTMVSFDLETTGVDVETARIVTAGIVTCDPMSGSVHTDQWLADPGVDIPAEAAAVHGITTEMARAEGRPPGDVVAEIVGALSVAWRSGLPVIVYNAPYADALAAARVAWKIAERFPECAEMPLPQLHARQASWFGEQAASFEQYKRNLVLREEGAEAAAAVSVPREWPIRPVAIEGVPA